MFVMTVDQRGSRRAEDLVDGLLAALGGTPGLVRRFERTAGDELQGLLDDAATVVDIALRLARHHTWSVGIGVGPVRTPLPRSVRAASGPAFENARLSVQRATAAGPHLAVSGPDPASAEDAEVLLALLAEIVQRRTAQGWEVVDLLAEGHTQRDVAERLGVSAQAVSQRVRVAMWHHEQAARPLAARLLKEADS
ncbi:MAG: hypothetical protein ACLGIV_12285 [Actinomycetes bacterium]